MNINYDYLRHLKAEKLKSMHNADAFVKKDSLDVWQGENATILPIRKSPDPIVLFGAGGVADCNGNYLELSSIDGRVTGGYSFEKSVYKDLKVVYCGYLVNQWGHFLVEAISRLWYFLKYDNDTIDKYVFILEQDSTREIYGNYKEFLTLIGIWDKVEIINTPTTYREVIVPEVSYYRTKFYSQEFIDIFKAVTDNAIDDSDTNYPDKIYLSRSKLSKAQKLELGLDCLDNYFIKNGYTVLFPEEFSLRKLILHIKHADICAAVSGSLPHNFLFADNDKKILILERNVINNEIQCEINIAKNLNVTYVDANIPIYSVIPSYGPFILGYSDMLEKYTLDFSMQKPDDEFMTDKYKKSLFQKYMKAYKEKYHYQWHIDDWFMGDIPSLYEGYEYGLKYFKEYLCGQKPFTFTQYLISNRYVKQLVRIIKKLT